MPQKILKPGVKYQIRNGPGSKAWGLAEWRVQSVRLEIKDPDSGKVKTIYLWLRCSFYTSESTPICTFLGVITQDERSFVDLRDGYFEVVQGQYELAGRNGPSARWLKLISALEEGELLAGMHCIEQQLLKFFNGLSL